MVDNMPTTALEKQSLEAHVDLCSMRYKQLDLRLTILETKMDRLSDEVLKSQKSLSTVIISSSATVVAGLIGLITTILMKF